MQSVEDLTDAAIQALIAGLDGELAAQEAKYAATFPLDLPRPRTDGGETGYGDYYPGGVAAVIRYPTIEVAVPDLQGDTFSVDQHESDVTPTIVVRAWLQDAGRQLSPLYRKCCRYGSAIYNVLATPDVATARGSGFGPDVVVRRYLMRWRYNPETNTNDEVTSAVILVFYLDAPDIRP